MDWIAIGLCVAVWVPVHFGLWLYEVKKAAGAITWLRFYGVAATAAGIAIGLIWYPQQFSLLGKLPQWYLGLLPGAGLMAIAAGMMTGKRRAIEPTQAVKQLLHFLVVVGLFEEVWFRGVWFAAFGGQFMTAVVLGSVVFGVVHYNPFLQGRDVSCAVLSACAGLPFAAARYAGAGIIALAIGHGLFDFMFHYVYANKEPRYGSKALGLAFVVGCLVLAASVLWLGR